MFPKKNVDFFFGLWDYNTRLVGQGVKTPPSHGGNRGSIPLQAAHNFLYFSSGKELPDGSSFLHVNGVAGGDIRLREMA